MPKLFQKLAVLALAALSILVLIQRANAASCEVECATNFDDCCECHGCSSIRYRKSGNGNIAYREQSAPVSVENFHYRTRHAVKKKVPLESGESFEPISPDSSIEFMSRELPSERTETESADYSSEGSEQKKRQHWDYPSKMAWNHINRRGGVFRQPKWAFAIPSAFFANELPYGKKRSRNEQSKSIKYFRSHPFFRRDGFWKKAGARQFRPSKRRDKSDYSGEQSDSEEDLKRVARSGESERNSFFNDDFAFAKRGGGRNHHKKRVIRLFAKKLDDFDRRRLEPHGVRHEWSPSPYLSIPYSSLTSGISDASRIISELPDWGAGAGPEYNQWKAAIFRRNGHHRSRRAKRALSDGGENLAATQISEPKSSGVETKIDIVESVPPGNKTASEHAQDVSERKRVKREAKAQNSHAGSNSKRNYGSYTNPYDWKTAYAQMLSADRRGSGGMADWALNKGMYGKRDTAVQGQPSANATSIASDQVGNDTPQIGTPAAVSRNLAGNQQPSENDGAEAKRSWRIMTEAAHRLQEEKFGKFGKRWKLYTKMPKKDQASPDKRPGRMPAHRLSAYQAQSKDGHSSDKRLLNLGSAHMSAYQGVPWENALYPVYKRPSRMPSHKMSSYQTPPAEGHSGPSFDKRLGRAAASQQSSGLHFELDPVDKRPGRMPSHRLSSYQAQPAAVGQPGHSPDKRFGRAGASQLSTDLPFELDPVDKRPGRMPAHRLTAYQAQPMEEQSADKRIGRFGAQQLSADKPDLGFELDPVGKRRRMPSHRLSAYQAQPAAGQSTDKRFGRVPAHRLTDYIGSDLSDDKPQTVENVKAPPTYKQESKPNPVLNRFFHNGSGRSLGRSQRAKGGPKMVHPGMEHFPSDTGSAALFRSFDENGFSDNSPTIENGVNANVIYDEYAG